MPGLDSPFAIGSAVWPGTSKTVEECGELLQVLGKLMATGGATTHFSGLDLMQGFMEESADVLAAVEFMVTHTLDGAQQAFVQGRREVKGLLFERWHEETSRESGASAHEQRVALTRMLYDKDWDLGQRADVQDWMEDLLATLGGPVTPEEAFGG